MVNGRAMRSRRHKEGGGRATAPAAPPSQQATGIARRRSKDCADRKKKHIPLRPCNLRVVTGHRAGLGPLFGCQGRNCRSGRQARSSPSVRLSQASVLALSRTGETLLRYLVRGRAEDKLGMMCCVSGRGLDASGASLALASAETAHGEHRSSGGCSPPPTPAACPWFSLVDMRRPLASPSARMLPSCASIARPPFIHHT